MYVVLSDGLQRAFEFRSRSEIDKNGIESAHVGYVSGDSTCGRTKTTPGVDTDRTKIMHIQLA